MSTASAIEQQPWEVDDDGPGWAGDGGSDSDLGEDVYNEEAGRFLTAFLLSQHFAGKLSAKSLCIIAWWASRAGAKGSVADFALNPKSTGGHFQRKVDTVCGVSLKKHKFYEVSVPSHSRADYSRTSLPHPMRLPHEVVEELAQKTPDLAEKLRQARRSGSLPPAYETHSVVVQHPADAVVPLALFVDGVQFTRRANMVGFFLYDLLTSERRLLTVVRKSLLCTCGCKGWCTLSAIWTVLKWSLDQLARKAMPAQRHDGAQWRNPHDSIRHRAAGSELTCRGALLFIKGDWGEYSHSIGLAAWNTRAAPCPFCRCTTDDMYAIGGLSLEGGPWSRAGAEEYEQACRACEKRVVLTKVHHKALRPLLKFDRRQQGCRGRGLIQDYSPLGLCAGDRLEPCAELPDVGLFESLTGFPVTITFWRRSSETRVRHRCPLFAPEIGVSVERLQIDLMHTLYLGAAQNWCAEALWTVLESGALDTGGAGRTDKELLELRVERLRADLWHWYAQQAGQRPSDWTQLEDLTLPMLGSRASPTLKAKAAETKTLLPFVQGLLQTHLPQLRREVADPLLQAGDALLRFVGQVRSCRLSPSLSECQALHLNAPLNHFRKRPAHEDWCPSLIIRLRTFRFVFAVSLYNDWCPSLFFTRPCAAKKSEWFFERIGLV